VITKRKGDSGHPWKIPLEGVKGLDDTPLKVWKIRLGKLD